MRNKTPKLRPLPLADELAALLSALRPAWSAELQRLGKGAAFTRIYNALSRVDEEAQDDQ